MQYYTSQVKGIVSRTTAKKNNLPCKPKLYRRRNLRTNPHFGLKFHARWTSNLKLQIANFGLSDIPAFHYLACLITLSLCKPPFMKKRIACGLLAAVLHQA
ncbi:MAG TPA: hypothetical protein PLT49_00535, partial [Ferruginibacter sp.]|nr:hypothetical protein [Ferruginibacter sp.]